MEEQTFNIFINLLYYARFPCIQTKKGIERGDKVWKIMGRRIYIYVGLSKGIWWYACGTWVIYSIWDLLVMVWPLWKFKGNKKGKYNIRIIDSIGFYLFAMDLMILSTVTCSMLNQASSFHCHVLKASLVEYSTSIHLFGFLQRGRAKW